MEVDEHNSKLRTEQKAFRSTKGKSRKSSDMLDNLQLPECAKYRKEDPRQKKLNKCVAIYIAATNTPLSTVDNAHFQLMLNNFDPR
jgi:exopolysaccharide biosynthesis predicted pyruvyltransferase EpsI